MGLKRCQKCGSEFRCEGDKDCWCEQVNIHRVQMMEIAELYTDCICAACLQQYEAKEERGSQGTIGHLVYAG